MSKYITRPIGETFEWRGIKLQVVKYRTCHNCYFCGDAGCMNYRHVTGYYGELTRDDHKSIIFKRIFE